MKNLSLIVFVILIVFSSCDQQNQFGGPVYDFDGNMAIDRVKIDTYLANTPIDSLYRIHDPSGVIIIVQEEGEGTRPISNTVIYTDYIGSLLDGVVFDTSYEAVARENNIFQESRTYGPLVFTIPPPGDPGPERKLLQPLPPAVLHGDVVPPVHAARYPARTGRRHRPW